MRKLHPVACVVALALFPSACGGGTPAPKDESEATQGKGGGGDDSAPAASAAPADSSAASPAPAASAAPAADATPAPAPTGGGSGDLKAASSDDPWLASHQMPPKDVMKVMRANNAKVQACWKAALKNDPSTAGEVKLKFVITNDGTVRVWKDNASSMSDGDVTKCIGDVLSKQKFPKQKSPGDAWGTFAIAQ